MYFGDARPWDPQTLQRLDEHIDSVVKKVQSDANGLLTVFREGKLGEQAVAVALKSKETICAEVIHVAKCKEFFQKVETVCRAKSPASGGVSMSTLRALAQQGWDVYMSVHGEVKTSEMWTTNLLPSWCNNMADAFHYSLAKLSGKFGLVLSALHGSPAGPDSSKDVAGIAEEVSAFVPSSRSRLS